MYWWNGLKKYITECVAICPNCQQVKAEHQSPGGLKQDIAIPTWKWENVNMDFVLGFPRTRRQYDSICGIVYRVTESANFIPMKTTYLVKKYTKLYLKEIARMNGVPLSIIFDKSTQFASHFWKAFQSGLGTKLKHIIEFHPQKDGLV